MDRLDTTTANLLDSIVEQLDRLAGGRIGVKTSNKADYILAHISAFFFAKTVCTFKGFALLVKRGYTCEAEFLTRANFETLVDWLYIADAPQERTERYVDYLEACRCRPLSTMDTLVAECGFTFPTVPEKTRTEIARLKRGFLAKYEPGKNRFPDSWSGKTLRDRAKAVGMLPTYLRAYKRQSELIHGGPQSHRFYLDFTDGAPLGLKTEPEWEDWQWAIAIGCLVMMCCLETANEHLQLRADNMVVGLREQLEPWLERHMQNSSGDA